MVNPCSKSITILNIPYHTKSDTLRLVFSIATMKSNPVHKPKDSNAIHDAISKIEIKPDKDKNHFLPRPDAEVT